MDIQSICHQLVTKQWTFRAFVTNWLQNNGHSEHLSPIGYKTMDFFNFGPQKARNLRTKNGPL